MTLDGYETKLFGPSGQPLLVTKAGLYFSPYSNTNSGLFNPYTPTYSKPAEDSVSQYDRQTLVALSQYCNANMADVNAAITQLAELVVGVGMDPIYNGQNDIWEEDTTKWLKNGFYYNCSWNGFAFDWKSCWKLAIKKIIVDGDVLLVLEKDRFGYPKIDFIENYRIANRSGQVEIANGKFSGYPIRDGVVYNSNNTPIGYQILGRTKDDDYIIATPSSCMLLFNPFTFEKGRGLPAISSAMKDAKILREIDDYISQMIKVESSVYLIEKNDTGRAPQSRVMNPFATQTGTTSTTTSQPAQPVRELWYGGVRYTKPDGDIKSLATNRPATQVVDFLTRLEKRMLMTLPFPHQFLLTPENIGGASSRGVKELLVRGIQSKQQLIERPALKALQFAISAGMTIGTIKENYSEDYTNWGFTRAAEIVLDASYERTSDLADYFAGVKSIDEITSKYGKRYKDVVKQRVKDYLVAKQALIDQNIPEPPDMGVKMIVGRELELPSLVPVETVSNKEQ